MHNIKDLRKNLEKFKKKLSDRNFNDWWVNFDHDFSRINYGGGFLQYNLTGRADVLEFTFRRGFIRELYSSYYIPYLSKKQKGGLEVNFNLIEFSHFFLILFGFRFFFAKNVVHN